MKKKKIKKLLKLFIYYSMLGFIFETLVNIFLRLKKSSGMIFGPFTILYFFGYVLMKAIHNLTKNINNKVLRKVYFFISFTVFATILEFCAGHLCHIITGKILWSYENYPLHFGKYISFFTSLGWGLMALIFNYKFSDKVDEYIYKIDDKLTYALFLLYLCDVSFCISFGF